MKYTVGNRRLEKQLKDASSIKTAFGPLAKLIVRRLDEIESAPSLMVLMQISQTNCHPLKGRRKGQWAVNVSGNYRIIFQITDDPLPMKSETEIDHANVKEVEIVEIIDYH